MDCCFHRSAKMTITQMAVNVVPRVIHDSFRARTAVHAFDSLFYKLQYHSIPLVHSTHTNHVFISLSVFPLPVIQLTADDGSIRLCQSIAELSAATAGRTAGEETAHTCPFLLVRNSRTRGPHQESRLSIY